MLEQLQRVPGWVSGIILIALSIGCAFAPNFLVALGVAVGALLVIWIIASAYFALTHHEPPAAAGSGDAALRTYSIRCPRCGWSGPVKRAQTQVVDGHKEVSCPKCDRILETAQ